MILRVALYARYSDERQNPLSVDDQLALCRRHAAARGWTVVDAFSDAAISGAAMANRPGLMALLAAAESGAFDVVLVEHQDRLTRSLEHSAGMFNLFKMWNVAIATPQSDRVSFVESAVYGIVGQMQREAISDKTSRGMRANAEKGLATGSRLYGYRSEPGGGMAVVPDEAAVIVDIFTRYAGGGLTGREIADQLNREGVAAPRGGLWRGNAVTGSRQRGNGILHTELYAGVKVWNRLDVRKDPTTGRRTPTVRAETEWRRTPVPHLRIVPDDLWDAVQARLEALAKVRPEQQVRRRTGLFSGLFKCGACGGSYTVYNAGRLICAAHREKGDTACANNRTVSRTAMETRVLEGLRTRLLSPEAVAAYVRAYHRAWSEEEARRRVQTAPLQAELAQIERTIKRLVDAVCDGTDSPAMRERLTVAEARKAALAGQLADARADDQSRLPVTLHPRLPEIYAARVADLQARLGAITKDSDPADIDLVQSVRALVDKITITPSGPQAGAPVDVVLHGRLALFLTNPDPSAALPYGRAMVAGARYSRSPTFAGPVFPIAV